MVIIAYGVNDRETYSPPECIGPFETIEEAEQYIQSHDLRSDPRIEVEIWPLRLSRPFVESSERPS